MLKPFRPARYGLAGLWILLPIAIILFLFLNGLPHMIWEYEYRSHGSPYDPLADRTYYYCTFIGPYGAFRRPAINGECAWVRFFKEGDQ